MAARQLTLYKMRVVGSNADQLCDLYKGRAAIAASMLEDHARIFKNSESGRAILNQIFIEVSAGQVTVDALNNGFKNAVAGPRMTDSLVTNVVSHGMSKNIYAVQLEPGRCAGHMLVPDDLPAFDQIDFPDK